MGGDSMAYKIEYSPESACRYPQMRTRRKEKWGGWFCLAAILGTLLWIRSNGVPDILIPGDPEVTREAAAGFVHDISDGIAVKDAATAFCRAILDGAGF